ncbi:glycosyltransferase family 39 protein [Halobium salinum]|uniref:Glycosyltransferase family 39 protein n=1 Tax=Halobium salinum TaxID=1364940 RepID=A0ABD5PAI6_9EURY|nr:glycosyltransferase family 39 protein [Halobium salinum]
MTSQTTKLTVGAFGLLFGAATFVLTEIGKHGHPNGRVIYIVSILALFVPALIWFAKGRYTLSVLAIVAANFVRWYFELIRFGMFSGVDNYGRFHQFKLLLQYGHIGFPESNGYPGPNLFIAALQIPFDSFVVPWNAALLCTAVLIPLVVYLPISSFFGQKLGALATIVVSTDFVYLLNSTSLLKENLVLLLFFVLLGLMALRSTRSWSDHRYLRQLALIAPIAAVIALTHYTSSYLLLSILVLLIVAYALLRRRNASFDPQFDRFRYLVGATGVLFGAIVLWANVGADPSFIEWQLDALRSFGNVALGGESLIGSANTVGGSDEKTQFLFGSDRFLFIYNWLYRVAMLAGAPLLLWSLFRKRSKNTGIALAGVAITGLPIVWLVLPILSKLLHATRVARFSLVFYAPFIAAFLLAALAVAKRGGPSNSRTLHVGLTVLVLTTALVGPSAYKSSTDYDFRDQPDDSLVPTTGHTELQRHSWALVTAHTSQRVGGSAPFNEMALMTGTVSQYTALPDSNVSLVVVKDESIERGVIIGFDGPLRKPIPFTPPGRSTVYTNGEYVARYGT